MRKYFKCNENWHVSKLTGHGHNKGEEHSQAETEGLGEKERFGIDDLDSKWAIRKENKKDKKRKQVGEGGQQMKEKNEQSCFCEKMNIILTNPIKE